MKKSLVAVAVLSAFAGAAQADDAVTLYGVVDAAIRSTSNIDPVTGNSYNGFSQGLFNGSRFGLKGEEKLDNGMRAIYTLEAGFVLGTGAGDQQGQLFGRQAWAGLADDSLGTLTLGRQYGNFSDAIGTGDVFGEKHGNMIYSGNNGANNFPNQGDTVSENGFIYGLMGYRWDNSVLYANKFGSVKLGLMHSFSGQPNGSAPTTTASNNITPGNHASMNAISLGYTSSAFNLSLGYQAESDGTAHKHTDVGFGANYMYGEKDGVYLSYFTSKYDAGFTRIGLGTNSSFSFNTTTNILVTARQDKVAELSVNNYVTEKLNLIAALYHDGAADVAVAGDSGSRMGELVTLDYYLSKNTDTYLMGAHTKLNSALVGNINGGNIVTGAAAGYAPSASVNTVMVGFRHRF